MKTKYIKVSTADRLPYSFGHYVTFTENNEQGYNYYDDSTCEFRSESIITHWLQEVPDYEYEMLDMLEECRLQLEHLNSLKKRGTTNSVLSRLKTLLTKIK